MTPHDQQNPSLARFFRQPHLGQMSPSSFNGMGCMFPLGIGVE